MSSTDTPPTGVVNSEALLSAFGFWPSFHDAEVHSAFLDRGTALEPPSITLVVYAFACDRELDENGFFRITTSVLVTLKCADVRESELFELGHQNVLCCMGFESTAEGLVRVTLEPCYGLWGSILCSEVGIESVTPWRDSPPRIAK
jgi:Phosphoenolpyruvate synthase/pyruvate phosphate dikinase